MDLRAAVALSLIEGVHRSRVAASLREATAERPGADTAALVAAALAPTALPRGPWPTRSAARTRRWTRPAGPGCRPSGGGTTAILRCWPRFTIPRPSCGCGATRPPWRRRPSPWSGRRAASTPALETARALAADLARRGVVVVSGLARGVDSAAHRGALDGKGVTVAVLGSGADRDLSAASTRAWPARSRSRAPW